MSSTAQRRYKRQQGNRSKAYTRETQRSGSQSCYGSPGEVSRHEILTVRRRGAACGVTLPHDQSVLRSETAVLKSSHFSRFHSDLKSSIRFSPVPGNAPLPSVTKTGLVNTK